MISSLRVNDLTFILLTWRKWLAPNNASRQQMGFNSGFKGLTDAMTVAIKHIDHVKDMSLCHCMTCFFYNKPKSQIDALNTQNTAESNRIVLHTQNTTALGPSIYFNWNTSVIGHKRGRVGDPQAYTTAKVNSKLLSHYLYKVQFPPHRMHLQSLLQAPTS